ncbi:Dynactin subunit 4 [Plecturocebus cupreus]
MPSAEAKLKKSRCANRFDCPGCRPTLHPGRGHRLTASRRAKATVRKACYVACGFCRRASRDVRMADKPAARRRRFAGTWKPSRPADQQTDGTLSAAQREKVERDRRKLARRGNGMPGLFRTPVVQASATTSGASVSTLTGLSRKEGQDQKETKTAPARAADEVEPPPADEVERPP